ncbi:iron-siderophore ABC transporter substrate-binding protein [Vibrio cincinnatiensis]|nr:iron-siderophore ABC transporter substrate-binding protein [Vibrio cincinnatiensis]
MCVKPTTLFLRLLLLLLLGSSHVMAAIQIHDGRKTHSFEQVPQRVVVLNWDLLEQVLELEVTPVGAPNLPGYREWVVLPAVPDSVVDIGTRAEPNLETIAALKPEVILAASPQQDLITTLERIAPVIYLPNFEQQDNAAQIAIQQFKTLAQLFDKTDLAEQKLADMAQWFAELNQQLQQALGSPLPSVVVMRFSNPTSVFLYGENSTTHYVLDQLGLAEALPQPARQWGIIQKRLNALQHVKQGYVLYILPFAEEEKIKQSILWKAMPFVRQGQVNSVRSVWSYGGAMSLRYTAEAVTESLLEVAPKS